MKYFKFPSLHVLWKIIKCFYYFCPIFTLLIFSDILIHGFLNEKFQATDRKKGKFNYIQNSKQGQNKKRNLTTYI